MKCDICSGKLTVQQTVTNYSDNKVVRRRFCPKCRRVFISEEKIKDVYNLDQEQHLFLQTIQS